MKARLTKGQLAAVVAGNALEFYDFLIFGFFAIQIGAAFFPQTDPTARLLMTLAVFGAGFLTRPLGGLFLGRLGDRIGRKPVMLFTFALMGAAIAGLALTPSYASIGIAAPILVVIFRLAQGFALGGEVGPSTAFLMEAAPERKRGLYVSLQSATQYAAVLAVGLVGTLLSILMPPDVFGAYGWRVAMLLGAVVIPFAYALRRSLPETLEVAPGGDATPPPLRVAGFALIAIAGMTMANYALNYITIYVQHVLGQSAQVAAIVTVIGGATALVGALLGGRLSDRHGRRPVMLIGGVALMLLSVPGFFVMLLAPTLPMMAAVTAVLALLTGMLSPPILTNITESYPAMFRARSLGLIYALAVAAFGGSAQYVVTWLIAETGSPLAPAWYVTGAMLLGLIGMAAMRETAPVKIKRPG